MLYHIPSQPFIVVELIIFSGFILFSSFSKKGKFFALLVVLVFFIPIYITINFRHNISAKKGKLLIINYKDNEESSPYKKWGEYFKRELLNSTSLKINNIRNTTGSLDSLIQMESAKDDEYLVSIVQADVLYHYLNGQHKQFNIPRSKSKIRAVCKLFPEWLHVYTNDGRNNISLFREATLGKQGSGTLVTGMNIGEILGANWKDNIHSSKEQIDSAGPNLLKLSIKSPSLSIKKEDKWQLTYLREQDARVISNAFNSSLYNLVKLNKDEKRYKNYYELFQRVNSDNEELPKTDAFYTISVDAILVCSSNTPDEFIASLLKILANAESKPSDSESYLKDSYFKYYTKNSAKVPNYNISKIRLENLPISKHKVTRSSLIGGSRALLNFNLFLMYLVWILGSILLLIKYKKKLTDKKGQFILRAFFVFVLLHLIIAIFIWIAEFNYESLKPESELQTQGVERTFEWMYRYVTAGDNQELIRSPISLLWIGFLKGGYAVSSILMSIGLGIEMKNRWERVMKEVDIVVIGWNKNSFSLIEEIGGVQSTGQGKSYIILIDDTHGPKPSLDDSDNLIIQKPTLDKCIDELKKKVHLNKIQSIIVLPYYNSTKNADLGNGDLWVLNALSCLRDKIDEDVLKNIQVVAEVLDSNHGPIAKNLGAEAVCMNDFGKKILVHLATKGSFISDVFKQLMNTTVNSNEIYPYLLTEKHIKVVQTFAELIFHFQSLDGGSKYVILGIVRGHNTILNPERHFPLKKEDKAIILSMKSPEQEADKYFDEISITEK